MSSPVHNQNKKMVILVSKDEKKFEVEEKVISLSVLLKDAMDHYHPGDAIPLPNVNANILAKVIEYCQHHTVEKGKIDDLKMFDEDFVKEDSRTLLDLAVAANYLHIKGLMDLACQAVADVITNMSPKEIREMLDIKNDYSPEEEQKVRDENAWAFEEFENQRKK